MTPQEKAQEIMNQMLGLEEEDLTKFDYIDHQAAKHFALIAVEHIIDSNPYKIVLEGKFKTESSRYDVAYWEQVKKELNNL